MSNSTHHIIYPVAAALMLSLIGGSIKAYTDIVELKTKQELIVYSLKKLQEKGK